MNDSSDSELIWQHLCRVLAGARVSPLEPRTRKTLKIAELSTTGGGVEITITPNEFLMRRANDRRRNRYFVSLVPAFVSALLDSGGVGKVDQPLLTGLLPGRHAAIQWPKPQLMWIAPGERELRIVIRPLGPNEQLPSKPQAVAAVPELSMPERAVFEPPPPVYRTLDGKICRTCGEQPVRWRELRDGYLVCPACGCSTAP